jgi:hypothetical protein
MNWDDLDWNNFSCVDMARKIKNELDEKFANMAKGEISKYLEKSNLGFNEYINSLRVAK